VRKSTVFGTAAKVKRAAWSSSADDATGDALSTAFMVMPPEGIKQCCLRHPEVLAMAILDCQDGQEEILRFGPWDELGSG